MDASELFIGVPTIVGAETLLAKAHTSSSQLTQKTGQVIDIHQRLWSLCAQQPANSQKRCFHGRDFTNAFSILSKTIHLIFRFGMAPLRQRGSLESCSIFS
jgi:hypothetical protein